MSLGVCLKKFNSLTLARLLDKLSVQIGVIFGERFESEKSIFKKANLHEN